MYYYSTELEWLEYSPEYNPYVKLTLDQIHPSYPKEGGTFESNSLDISFTDSPTLQSGFHGINGGSQIAKIRCISGLNEVASGPPSAFAECEALGPTAWNRFKPAQPDVSGAVFIGELGSVKDMLFTSLNSFRSLGSNYLAYQFGWKPFLSDLRNWYNSLIELDQRIAQLQRDNGKWIRRRGTLRSPEQNISKTELSTSGAVKPSYYIFIDECRKEQTTFERAWFSGAFRYYIPGLNSRKWGKLRAIQELWDLKLTPEQIWQLIPFSWLGDWFSNIGDVISNYMSYIEDSLVAKYAYVMLTKETSTTHTVKGRAANWVRVQPPGGYYYYRQDYVPFTCSNRIETSSKNRAAAEPFGFSVSFDSLSSYQKSILIALGLTLQRR